MSAKAIFEADGKAILNYHLTRAPVIKPSPLPKPTKHNPPPRLCSLHFPEDQNVADVLTQAEVTYPWLLQSGAKFVAKPDQLIKRRGKSGLLALNKTWPEAKAWIAERAGKAQKVEHTEGVLRHFLVEPMLPHADDTEYYININSVRDVSAASMLSHPSALIKPGAQVRESPHIASALVVVLSSKGMKTDNQQKSSWTRWKGDFMTSLYTGHEKERRQNVLLAENLCSYPFESAGHEPPDERKH